MKYVTLGKKYGFNHIDYICEIIEDNVSDIALTENTVDIEKLFGFNLEIMKD